MPISHKRKIHDRDAKIHLHFKAQLFSSQQHVAFGMLFLPRSQVGGESLHIFSTIKHTNFYVKSHLMQSWKFSCDSVKECGFRRVQHSVKSNRLSTCCLDERWPVSILDIKKGFYLTFHIASCVLDKKERWPVCIGITKSCLALMDEMLRR